MTWQCGRHQCFPRSCLNRVRAGTSPCGVRRNDKGLGKGERGCYSASVAVREQRDEKIAEGGVASGEDFLKKGMVVAVCRQISP